LRITFDANGAGTRAEINHTTTRDHLRDLEALFQDVIGTKQKELDL